MARQAIDLTTVQANGKKGESAISAFTKINSMTSELYQAYFKSTIVGTVSQSSGVPTGAIIERGSNSNGEYIRYADGTQICFGVGVSVTQTSSGVMTSRWLFPAAFYGTTYSVAISLISSLDFAQCAGLPWVQSKATSAAYVGFRGPSGTYLSGTTVQIDVVIVGRWF